MTTDFIISSDIVHLWHVDLAKWLPRVKSLEHLLSADEIARARQFRFANHQEKFIIARGILRQLLANYLHTQAKKIEFVLGEYGKPYLKDNPSLQFNISHSHNRIVYAMTLNHEVGVDIEKIDPPFKEAIAKRFFNPKEYTQLQGLSLDKQVPAFYRLWVGKEAVIKLLGTGLLTNLHEFSINMEEEQQQIFFKSHPIYLQYFSIASQYQSAFAMEHNVSRIICKEWI